MEGRGREGWRFTGKHKIEKVGVEALCEFNSMFLFYQQGQ